MRPSQKAIEREFEALRDIRRRSSAQGGPGSLLLDPDLPAEQSTSAPPPLSPQAWTANDTSSGTSDNPKSPVRGQEEDANSAADDPFNLFWVPAHLHPEIAPTEFREFLKEHARPPSEGNGPSSLGRSNSATSNLNRKRSMLSRQYKPRADDGVENEDMVVPLRRNKSIFSQEGPQLTISDLQKLEELADEAAKSDDPTKLRRVLRRSMTLNVSPSFLDQMDNVPDPTDEADAPIIIPPRNQILRRTARTKIRKPNLSGDGGGHRFPASRRKSAGRAGSADVVTSPTDGSSSGHGEIEPSLYLPIPTRKRTLDVDDSQDNRRLTYTDETSIFEAYAETPEDDRPPSPQMVAPEPASIVVDDETIPAPLPARSSVTTGSVVSPSPQLLQPQPQPAPASILHQPQPQRLSPKQQLSRSPSPEPSSSSFEIPRPESRSSVTSEAPSVSSTASERRKEKDKKSLWRKVGGSTDKNAKKHVKEKEKEKEKEKDKDTGFFGALFGGGKKKQDESAASNIGGGAGPATAAALLGASKSNNSKAYSPSISPQLGNPYARYPIHVERAVYRLSHIKLANPRRPLYEQVLISNLMFWYLGVINKSHQGPGQNQNQSQQAQGQAQGQAQAGGAQAMGLGQDGAQATPSAGAEKEREQREREEREKAERERIETKEKMEQRREPRRGSLTKPSPAGGASAGGRRAEIPVKGPQYHLQSQVIEQEYGGVGVAGPGPAPVARTSSAPPPSMAQAQGYNGGGYSQRSQPVQPLPQQQMYAQPNGNQQYYYGRSQSVDFTAGNSSTAPATNLPPGAMPPLPPTDQGWLATQGMNSGSGRSQPPPHGYSQSTEFGYNQHVARSGRLPQPNNFNSSYDWGQNGVIPGAKAPSRSLSANAVSPLPQVHGHKHGHSGQTHNGGGLKKKINSASAVSPDRRQRASEDEDVPLAMWQAQRRK